MSQATTDRLPGAATIPGTSTDRILGGLSTIAQAVHQPRLHERLLRAAGVRLDRAGASLLAKLDGHGAEPPRVTALAERLNVDTPTVTRKLQQLERLGLVARSDDPGDKRAHRIRLTPRGRSTLARLVTARRSWLDQLLEDWSEADRTTFARLLERFTARLAEELDGPHGN
jgi:DNA-binding MarR family transcriptional regulator